MKSYTHDFLPDQCVNRTAIALHLEKVGVRNVQLDRIHFVDMTVNRVRFTYHDNEMANDYDIIVWHLSKVIGFRLAINDQEITLTEPSDG